MAEYKKLKTTNTMPHGMKSTSKMVKGKPVPKLKPEKYKTTNTMPHGMKSTSKMVKGKPVPKLKPEKYKKLKVKSKVAKNLKISDAELERLKKASPYDKLDEGLYPRGRGRFGKKNR